MARAASTQSLTVRCSLREIPRDEELRRRAVENLEQAVLQLEQGSGKGLSVGGVLFPRALAELGLIDEHEFVVHRRLAGHGPTLFAVLSKRVDLQRVSRLELGSGAVAMRYEPKR